MSGKLLSAAAYVLGMKCAFKGRANRIEYGLFLLYFLAVSALILLAWQAETTPFWTLFFPATAYAPTLIALQVRRLRRNFAPYTRGVSLQFAK